MEILLACLIIYILPIAEVEPSPYSFVISSAMVPTSAFKNLDGEV